MNLSRTPGLLALLAAGAALLATRAGATITIDTSNAKDWKISNGTISLDWDSTAGNVWGVFLASHPSTNLVDTSQTQGDGNPKGLYMDNTGLGSGTVTTGYHLNGYLDWWFTVASNSSNAFTYTQHFILANNDSGFHTYIVFNHSASDIAGSLGQIQWVFRVSPTLFTNTYSNNSGLGNLGVTKTPEPVITTAEANDPGRNVQNAVLDLHGISLPSGYTREFETKYDYAGYQYLQEAYGVYGGTFGAWAVFPSLDSMVGGPTKQNLWFTGSILMGEMQSDHERYNIGYTPPQGVNSTRIYGPVYYHFNTGTNSDTMYSDALNSIANVNSLYDYEGVLVGAGYTPTFNRGTVSPTISGGGSSTTDTAWVVLADNKTDFEFTNQGHQYWANNNSSGNVSLTNVVPGTYRLSAYKLGQWGEMRVDNVVVNSKATTTLSATYVPENFSTSAPIWTIGTPDRSAHEFLHGKNGSQDDREYYGAWNYWQDFASTSGAVIYYATAVGSTPATNNLAKWNYIQWGSFDPGLFGGFYNSSDDTTDGYKYIVPSYVGNPATATVPPWQVHFTTTSSQLAQGQYVVLSVALASTNSDLTVSLNGHSLTWKGSATLKKSDAQVRSGLSGTNQWVAFEFPTSELNAAGADNVFTFAVSGQGVMYDALRMEITNTSANPSTRGWHDYEYVNASTYTPADDAVANP